MGALARYLLGALALSASLSACTGSVHSVDAGAPVGEVTLPVFEGWYAGRQVLYIVTDISSPDMARAMNSNLSPRLSDGLPSKASTKSILDKVYVSDDKAQAKIFASAPSPIGPLSKDEQYTPVWQVVSISWNDPKDKIPLRSEDEVLSAVAAGSLKATKTDTVINCPIVGLGLQPLIGTKIVRN